MAPFPRPQCMAPPKQISSTERGLLQSYQHPFRLGTTLVLPLPSDGQINRSVKAINLIDRLTTA